MEETNDVKETENISEQGKTQEEEIKMEELLAPVTNIKEGEIIKVKVVGKSSDGMFVDMGLKSEGFVERSEFGSSERFERITSGMEIPVFVIKLHSREGHPVISYKRAREIEAWDMINKALKNSTSVEGTIIKRVKGGFIVDVGIEAFLPGSQLEIYKIKNLDKYMGQKFEFLIVEANRSKNNLVLSRRKLLEIEQRKKRQEVLKNLSEGQVVDGIVAKITGFGAFVDIGGMDGLLHIGDITWGRLNRASDILSVRQNIKVKVLKIDREKEKVSLGIKQLTPHPWENVLEKYPVGTVLKGKITSISDFGVFVEIKPGLEGLLHVSEISWYQQKSGVLKDFKAGQEIEVKVISIDAEKEKLSLSLKRMGANPWEEARLKYPKGTKIKGKVTNLTPFGAFIKFTEHLEGLVHINDMSWMKKVRHPNDVLKGGQEIEAVVLEINPENEKISLSLKHLDEDPFKKYHTGKVVTGKVKRVVDFGAFVELEPGIEALLRASEIGPKKPAHTSDLLKVNQDIEAKVIKSDSRERKIDISIRKLEHDRERELLRKYVDKKDKRPTLGQVLEEK